MGTGSESWHLELSYDQWLPLPVSGQRPAARYKHAAAMFDEKLYILGGSRNGRYLSDIQVLDLKTLSWSAVKLSTVASDAENKDRFQHQVIPAIAGHSVVKWESKLYLLAGLSKNASDKVTVHYIDLESYTCGVVETYGTVPVARSGQSVTVFGSKVIMFGGEDKNRRLLNDIHVLDLETMTWTAVETTQGPPSPRFDHTAAIHGNRYLFIFGGCSHSIFYNDLHVLDLETMEWSRPQMQGDMVTPRAGHAGVAVDGNLYIVGGGDNKSGAPETLVVDMSKLAVSVVTRVQERDPLASEGISICSASLGGETFLFTFGGYNGKYYNEIFCMRAKPKNSSRPKILQSPAAAAAAASVTAAYALTKSQTDDSKVIHQVVEDNTTPSLTFKISSIREEKVALQSSLSEATKENSVLKAKLDELNGNYEELSKDLHSVRGQVAAEISRCAKLEAQIEALQKILESLPALEEEVRSLRSDKSAYERDIELSAEKRQGSAGSGLWKWVAG